MVEPISKTSYDDRSARRPPSLFAHNVQKVAAQNVHAQASTYAKGVLGRILAALGAAQPSGAAPFRTKAYSVAGNAKVIEGGAVPPEMLSTRGVVRYSRYSSVAADLARLAANESASIFGEQRTCI